MYEEGSMSDFLEILMLICFGASWPMNVIKSYRVRTSKGKSPAFLYLILSGYVARIVAKFVNPDFMENFSEKWYILFFYFLNFIMVGADLLLYYRNRKIDQFNNTVPLDTHLGGI